MQVQRAEGHFGIRSPGMPSLCSPPSADSGSANACWVIAVTCLMLLSRQQSLQMHN